MGSHSYTNITTNREWIRNYEQVEIPIPQLPAHFLAICTILYVLIFLLGLIGNIAVIFVVFQCRWVCLFVCVMSVCDVCLSLCDVCLSVYVHVSALSVCAVSVCVRYVCSLCDVCICSDCLCDVCLFSV